MARLEQRVSLDVQKVREAIEQRLGDNLTLEEQNQVLESINEEYIGVFLFGKIEFERHKKAERKERRGRGH